MTNLTEIIDRLSQEFSWSKGEIKGVLDRYHDLLRRAIEQEGSVRLRDFGSFQVVERAARKYRNIHTGEIMNIPPRRGIKYKPSCTMLRKLNVE